MNKKDKEFVGLFELYNTLTSAEWPKAYMNEIDLVVHGEEEKVVLVGMIEKAIPKKVIHALNDDIKRGFTTSNLLYYHTAKTGYCPRCLEIAICDRIKPSEYCVYCGQRLDWSDYDS